MSVQAQYPFTLLMAADFRYRLQQQAGANDSRNLISLGNGIIPGALEDFQLQPATPVNLMQGYNIGLDSVQSGQRAMDTSGITVNESENDLISNLAGARKRPREAEEFLLRSQPLFPATDLQQKVKRAPLSMVPSAAGAIPTSLSLTLDLNPSSSGVISKDPVPAFLKKELQSQMKKQREEVDDFIKQESECMKQALEEKRQKHTQAIFATIEKGLLKRFKEREVEFERASRRNLELEERVKQLTLESQIWQNMARNNELLASNLRTSLEQVVAQSREQSKEGYGEIEVDDAESCHYGEGGILHARKFKENMEMKEQRTCRVCRTNEVSMLLLPCRHLCLCKDCESRLDVCPLCRSAKSVSVQVKMT